MCVFLHARPAGSCRIGSSSPQPRDFFTQLQQAFGQTHQMLRRLALQGRADLHVSFEGSQSFVRSMVGTQQTCQRYSRFGHWAQHGAPVALKSLGSFILEYVAVLCALYFSPSRRPWRHYHRALVKAMDGDRSKASAWTSLNLCAGRHILQPWRRRLDLARGREDNCRHTHSRFFRVGPLAERRCM